MSKVKIVLNSSGVRSLLRSAEMAAICREQAEGMKSRYGSDTETSTYYGRNRVNVSVYKDENDHSNRLLKAMKK